MKTEEKNIKKKVINYISRLQEIAQKNAEEYKNARNAPFEISTNEIRVRKERYIKSSWQLWGAIQTAVITKQINEKEQEEYENEVERLDEIAYTEE